MKIKKQDGSVYKIKCVYCGEEVNQTRVWQKFCSRDCQLANWAVKQVKKGA